MGQKINPVGFRLSVQRNWTSRWYSNSKGFSDMLLQDIEVPLIPVLARMEQRGVLIDGDLLARQSRAVLSVLALARAAQANGAPLAGQRWLDLCAGAGGKARLLAGLAAVAVVEVRLGEVDAGVGQPVRPLPGRLHHGRGAVRDTRPAGALVPDGCGVVAAVDAAVVEAHRRRDGLVGRGLR